MSDDLIWGAPPPKGTGRYKRPESKWQTIARLLKDRPGEWAQVHTADKNASGAAASALGRHLPRQSFEVAQRSADGVVAAWARYIGEEA